MAQFRATIKGQRGEASRLGSKNSGLRAYVNGWDSGVLVEAENRDGRDIFYVYTTGGSNGRVLTRQVGYISAGSDGSVQFVRT